MNRTGSRINQELANSPFIRPCSAVLGILKRNMSNGFIDFGRPQVVEDGIAASTTHLSLCKTKAFLTLVLKTMSFLCNEKHACIWEHVDLFIYPSIDLSMDHTYIYKLLFSNFMVGVLFFIF